MADKAEQLAGRWDRHTDRPIFHLCNQEMEERGWGETTERQRMTYTQTHRDRKTDTERQKQTEEWKDRERKKDRQRMKARRDKVIK